MYTGTNTPLHMHTTLCRRDSRKIPHKQRIYYPWETVFCDLKLVLLHLVHCPFCWFVYEPSHVTVAAWGQVKLTRFGLKQVLIPTLLTISSQFGFLFNPSLLALSLKQRKLSVIHECLWAVLIMNFQGHVGYWRYLEPLSTVTEPPIHIPAAATA